MGELVDVDQVGLVRAIRERAGTKAGSAESDETNEEGAYKNKAEHIRAQNGNRYNISFGLCVIVYTLSNDNGNLTFCGTILEQKFVFFQKSNTNI